MAKMLHKLITVHFTKRHINMPMMLDIDVMQRNLDGASFKHFLDSGLNLLSACLFSLLLVITEQGATQDVKIAIAKTFLVSFERLPVGIPSRTASTVSISEYKFVSFKAMQTTTMTKRTHKTAYP